MINIFLIIIIIALVFIIYLNKKIKTQKEIDEIFGSPWYSTLVKEVDNIILKSQKS